MKDGGPAFPHDVIRADGQYEYGGMSLRQFYAAIALHGMYSSNGGPRDYEAAAYAFEVADAMIKEGEK